jgi:hypothetical protein
LSAKRNSPGAGTEAVKVLAGGLNNPIVNVITYDPSKPDFEYEARLRGFAEAWDIRQPLIDRLTRERDYWYERFANPGREFSEMRQRRIAQGAADYWLEFVAGGAQ